MTGAAYSRKRRPVKLTCVLLALSLLVAGAVLGIRHLAANPPFGILMQAFGYLDTYCIDAMDLGVSFEPDEELVRVKARIQISPEDNARSFVAFALSDRLTIERIAVSSADVGAAAASEADVGSVQVSGAPVDSVAADGIAVSDADVNSVALNRVDVRARRFWVVNLVQVPRELRGKSFSLEIEYSGVSSGLFPRLSHSYIDKSGALAHCVGMPRTLVYRFPEIRQTCYPRREQAGSSVLHAALSRSGPVFARQAGEIVDRYGSVVGRVDPLPVRVMLCQWTVRMSL